MKKSTFIEGAIVSTLAIYITKILGIIYVIPFYKIIGPSGGALYGYAYNIYNLFLIIAASGLPLAISKLTSEYIALKDNNKKYYLYHISKKIITTFSIISFLICFFLSDQIATLIIGNMTGGNKIEDVSFVIKCVSFAILVVPLLSISRGYMQGHRYMNAPAISQVLEQLVRIIILLFGSFTILKLFPNKLTEAIGVSVFAAAIGGLIAFIYLQIKLRKIKPKDKYSITNEEKKYITKKLITYSIPFIIINIANTLYHTVDMILVIKALNIIGLDATNIEEISSIFTTWGTKINTIITSFAVGIAISLIPNISKDRTLNNKESINKSIIKTISMFLYIILPLSIFMSIHSKEIWNIFYGNTSNYGPIYVKYAIIIAAIDALYILMSNLLQGLNKTKLIYKSVIIGLSINAILDIPLILLFNKLNIHSFYGAITATLIGYIISLIITFKGLNKDKYNYNKLFNILPRILISYSILIIINIILNNIISFNNNRLLDILFMLIIGIISLLIYILINKKQLYKLFKGKDM